MAEEEQKTTVGEAGEENVEALKKTLAEAKAQAEANLTGWQRAQADFANYKRRLEQEKEETAKFANATLIENLLPIIDDLERAFALLPPDIAKHSWVDGIRLIEHKLKAILTACELSPIKTVGEPFDPMFHEVVRQDKGEYGIIISEVQRGYTLCDRVLRPSKVVVGNGEEKS